MVPFSLFRLPFFLSALLSGGQRFDLGNSKAADEAELNVDMYRSLAVDLFRLMHDDLTAMILFMNISSFLRSVIFCFSAPMPAP